jgi:predicted DCC family thiol-disulfide oxidoreductase YuxK
VASPASGASELPLLVFDGDCGFCTTSVGVIERLLPVMPTAVPYQWADLDDLGLTEQEASERVWLVTDDHQYGGHLAVAALFRFQPVAAFRFFGWLGTVPPWSWLAAAAYALIARNRHRLPGGTPACRMQ